jgi:S1-C subfamily serine protease
VNRNRLLLVTIPTLIAASCTSAPPKASPLTAPAPIPATVVALPSTTLPVEDSLLSKVRPWVYRVRNIDCLAVGSSFELQHGIITNRHVASGAQTLQLSTWDGNDFQSPLEAVSTGPDLSLLAPTTTAFGTVTSLDPSVGERVWAAGYPLGDQLTLTPGTVEGYVSGVQFDEPNSIIRITNQVQHGNSGGPLVDSSGQVVGVVFAVEPATGYGLAIPASTLQQFLTNPGINIQGACVEG